MTESSRLPTNPYVAPRAEQHSAALSRAERNMLTEVLAMREPGLGGHALSRSVGRSFICSPIAVIFAGLFAAGAYALFELPAVYLGVIAFVAFIAVITGFLVRDLSEAWNTRALQGLLCSVIEFDEAERLLYGRPTAPPVRARSDEPLAAVPVEE